jgi:hypothetical protein
VQVRTVSLSVLDQKVLIPLDQDSATLSVMPFAIGAEEGNKKVSPQVGYSLKLPIDAVLELACEIELIRRSPHSTSVRHPVTGKREMKCRLLTERRVVMVGLRDPLVPGELYRLIFKANRDLEVFPVLVRYDSLPS